MPVPRYHQFTQTGEIPPGHQLDSPNRHQYVASQQNCENKFSFAFLTAREANLRRHNP